LRGRTNGTGRHAQPGARHAHAKGIQWEHLGNDTWGVASAVVDVGIVLPVCVARQTPQPGTRKQGQSTLNQGQGTPAQRTFWLCAAPIAIPLSKRVIFTPQENALWKTEPLFLFLLIITATQLALQVHPRNAYEWCEVGR